MANTNMDWRDWLCKQIVEAEVDLLREMVAVMAEMRMSAEVSSHVSLSPFLPSPPVPIIDGRFEDGR